MSLFIHHSSRLLFIDHFTVRPFQGTLLNHQPLFCFLPLSLIFMINVNIKMSVRCGTATHPAEVEDLGDGLRDEQDFRPVTSHNQQETIHGLVHKETEVL